MTPLNRDSSLGSVRPVIHPSGFFELTELSDVLIEDWRAKVISEGVKASTINRYVSALKTVLNYAYRRRIIPEHPLRLLQPLRVDSHHRVRYLEASEEERLKRVLVMREWRIKSQRQSANTWRTERGYQLLPDLTSYKFADHLRPMVLLSLNTGMRQGEMFNLRWEHISGDFILIPASNAKSRRSRQIPLNDEAQETLNQWRPLSGETGYVFKGRAGKIDNVRHAWKRVLSDANIEDFRWHDMRHHFASQLVMQAVPLNTVRELLGHADLQTTMRYAHLAPNHLREAVAVLNG